MTADENAATVELATRVRALRALGDPVRLRVVDSLEGTECSPDELAAMLGVPGNLLAHHLKVLQSAGLIVRHRSHNDRRRTYLRLRHERFVGLLPDPPAFMAPRVVFVCTHNSARSVMAEAAWRATSEVPAASAGTRPAATVNPRAAATLQAAGVLSAATAVPSPQHVADVLAPDDLIVSVCDAVHEELAPILNKNLHWSVPDPVAAGTEAAFAAAFADIAARVAELAPRVQLDTHSSGTSTGVSARKVLPLK